MLRRFISAVSALGGLALCLLAGPAAALAGAGYGSPTQFLTGSDDAWPVEAGDFDGDGDRDIAVGNFNMSSQGASVLVGNGDGTFQLPTTYATGGNPETMAIGKLDGGSDLDLVYGTNGSASVLLGGPGALFDSTTDFFGSWVGQSRGTGIADVNGDGKNDILVTEDENKLVYLRGKGDGTFPKQRKFKLKDSGPLAAGKINHDKRADVVTVADGKNGIAARLARKGRKVFRHPRRYDSLHTPVDARLADLNDDGDNDIVISGGREQSKRGGAKKGAVEVLLGHGDGHFGKPQKTPLGNPSVTGLDVGDVNGDGKLDVVVARYAGDVLVLRGRGNGEFHAPQRVDGGLAGQAYDVILARLDANNTLDIVTSNGPDNTITVILHD
jgi:hypothetical protein